MRLAGSRRAGSTTSRRPIGTRIRATWRGPCSRRSSASATWCSGRSASSPGSVGGALHSRHGGRRARLADLLGGGDSGAQDRDEQRRLQRCLLRRQGAIPRLVGQSLHRACVLRDPRLDRRPDDRQRRAPDRRRRNRERRRVDRDAGRVADLVRTGDLWARDAGGEFPRRRDRERGDLSLGADRPGGQVPQRARRQVPARRLLADMGPDDGAGGAASDHLGAVLRRLRPLRPLTGQGEHVRTRRGTRHLRRLLAGRDRRRLRDHDVRGPGDRLRDRLPGRRRRCGSRSS